MRASLLTQAEAELWRLQGRVEQPACCWIGEALEIEGDIDVVLFDAALRHEAAGIASLNRIWFETPDGPRHVPASPERWTLEVSDLTGEAAPAACAQARMQDLVANAPALGQGNPFRFALFRIGVDRWLWFQSYHHIAMDGLGMREVAVRVARTYTSLVEDASPTHAPEGEPAVAGGHWGGLLEGWTGPVRLAERAAPPARTAAMEPVRVRAAVATRLRRTARAAGVPFAHAMIAATSLWLNAVSGETDIVLGLAVRDRAPGAGVTPAMMTNIVPVRLLLTAGSTLPGLARAVAWQRREGRLHEDVRPGQVLRDLGMPGAQGYGPVVNMMPFDYRMTFAGTPCSARNVAIGPVEDLCLAVYDRMDGNGPVFELHANPDRYDAAQLHSLAQRLRRLLIILARAPDRRAADIDLLAPGERQRLLGPWAGERRPVAAAGIAELFAAQARARPAAPFLVHAAGTVSYGEMDAAARGLAAQIIRTGPGQVVAILLPRSPGYFVALLAIAMTGRAFAPIDPTNPAPRIAAMLEDSGAAVAVSSRDMASLLPPALPLIDISAPAPHVPTLALPPFDAAALAYVIFTSGTTGRPKAVAVLQRGIASLAAFQAWHLRLQPSSRIIQFAAPGFDAIVMELLMAVAAGACLVQPPDEERLGPALAATLARHAITHALLPPTALLDLDPATQAAPSTLVVGGEACPASLAARWSVGRRMINAYGPTEATACITMSEPLDGRDTPPIGRPVWNAGVYVLDPFGRPVPPGMRGELHVAGDAVAAGYLANPAATAERFVPCPFLPGGTMLRTGDQARFRPDGSLECFGRADRQLKLRGVRIEFEEVEAAFAMLPGVARAIVVEQRDACGRARLVGYVLPAPGAAIDPAALRKALGGSLPSIMIPAAIVPLDHLPLTPHGKIDHRRLPPPAAPARAVRPDTAGERQVAALVGAVLQQDGVSVDDDFFALGGDSLAAIRLVHRLNETVGGTMTVADIFRNPTVGAIAARIADRGAPTVSPFAVLLGFRVAPAFAAPACTAPSRIFEAGRVPWRTPPDFAPERFGQESYGHARFVQPRPALFCIHTGSGLGWAYSALLPHLHPAQPVTAVQARGLDGRSPLAGSLAAIAQDYADEILRVQPEGPYHLLGWSSGGPLAHLVATRLQELGHTVGLLASLDGYPAGPFYARSVHGDEQRAAAQADLRRAIEVYLTLGQTGGVDRRDVLDDAALARMIGIHVNTGRLLSSGRLGRFHGDLLLFTCRTPYAPDPMPPPEAWRDFVTGRIEAVEVDCHHDAMLMPDPAAFIGRTIAARLAMPADPAAAEGATPPAMRGTLVQASSHLSS